MVKRSSFWVKCQLLMRPISLLKISSSVLHDLVIIVMCGLVISCYLLKIAMCGIVISCYLLKIATCGLVISCYLLKMAICGIFISCYLMKMWSFYPLLPVVLS